MFFSEKLLATLLLITISPYYFLNIIEKSTLEMTSYIYEHFKQYQYFKIDGPITN